MRARQLWFGVVLILAGVLILMGNLGFLGWSFWGALRQLWPVLLISIGLTMLLAETRWVFLGPLLLIAAILVAALNPGGMQLGFGFPAGRYQIQRSASYSKAWDPSIAQGELELKVHAGTINLMGSADPAGLWKDILPEKYARLGIPAAGRSAVVTLSPGKTGGGFPAARAIREVLPWESWS